MSERCLYCGRALSPRPDRDAGPGISLAFDPGRGRVWTICDRCRGWNLWWREERWTVLAALERQARDEARVLYRTDHISLLEAGARRLVRVGPAPRREEAWWRYGRHLRRRNDRFRSPLARVGAVTYSAVSAIGHSVGLEKLTGDFRGATDRQAEILRWRRFGGTAWAGRAPCPACNSALIRLFFFRSRDLILLPASDGRAAIGLPCTRCDPWTVEKSYRFDEAATEPVLRRVLAWQNIAGATRAELGRSVGLIEGAGSADGFVGRLAAERRPLEGMGRLERLALEIAVNERAERDRLAGQAAALEAGWARAAELADIIDEELSGL